MTVHSTGAKHINVVCGICSVVPAVTMQAVPAIVTPANGATDRNWN